VPGAFEATPSVFVIDRSAVGTNVSVSVAVLLAGVGSVVPPGRATLAVLASVPVAVAEMMPVSANVAVPPASNETVALIEPVPDAGQDDPTDAVQVHVAPAIVPGTVSVTVPPVTTDGPEFDATIVYVTVLPGCCVVAPSVLVMMRSACGVRVSLSVAALLADDGSVTPAPTDTDAVFDNDPVAPGPTTPPTTKVVVPPTGRLTVALMLPTPATAGQVAPPVVVQLQVAPVSEVGNVSVIVEPGAADGPAFEATMVYVTVLPGTADVIPSVFVIDRLELGFRVSVSVAELLAPFESLLPAGAVIVTVLASDVVAVEEIVAVTVNVAVPDTASVTAALMLPLPDDAGQVEPLVAEHVHVAPVSVPGKVSATVAAVINDGPAFEATIV